MLCDLNQSCNIQSHIISTWKLSKWSQQGLTHCPRRSSGRPHGSVWWASCRSRCRPSAGRSAAGESPRSPTCRAAPEPPPSSPVGGCVYSSYPTIRGSASTRHTQRVVVVGEEAGERGGQVSVYRAGAVRGASLSVRLQRVSALRAARCGRDQTHVQGRHRLFGGPGSVVPKQGVPS